MLINEHDLVQNQLRHRSYKPSNSKDGKGFGGSGWRWGKHVVDLIRSFKVDTVLDYGAGEGTLQDEILNLYEEQGTEINFSFFEYDPAVRGIEQLPDAADLLICTDVLEHINIENLPFVLAHIYGLMNMVGLFTIALYPANKFLPDGTNTHKITQDWEWWLGVLRDAMPGAAIQQLPDKKWKNVCFTVIKDPGTLKKHSNFYWPGVHDLDKHVPRSLEIKSLRYVLDHLKNKRVAVQAGGSYGIWPKVLGKEFKHVYTFEPEPKSFNCLVANCPEGHIHKFQACLGRKHVCVSVGQKSFTSHSIVSTHGNIPTMSIDVLGLPILDAVFLDVEGFEYEALLGGQKTIDEFQPVILFEAREEILNRQGTSLEKIERMLYEWGYHFHNEVRKDRIYLPGGTSWKN